MKTKTQMTTSIWWPLYLHVNQIKVRSEEKTNCRRITQVQNGISIKGLETTVLTEGLKDWQRTPGTQAVASADGDSSSEGTTGSDGDDSDTDSDSEILSLFNKDLNTITLALTADDSLSAASASRAHAAKGLGKVPAAVEPLAVAVLARRSKRLEGVRRQYVVAELFPSISDTEGDDDDGVEFCWKDEA